MRTAPLLIALDWGTSNLRASLVGPGGDLLDHRAAPGGIMSVDDRRYEAALRAICGDWLQAWACPVIASGMIGSRNGWAEAPYVACPATIEQAARQLLPIALSDGTFVHVAPGLSCLGEDGFDDVMRGEETQIWGADPGSDACVILPGTHSKWVWTGPAGRIDRFQTWMTGELYGLWTRHGILGRLMRFGGSSPDDFAAGVRLGLAQHGAAHHVIFAARTAGLMGRITPEGLPDFLSGLLIGIEIGAATAPSAAADGRSERALRAGLDKPILLIGDEDLCLRYQNALDLAGRSSSRSGDGVTLAGQWRLALAAGLVGQEGR